MTDNETSRALVDPASPFFRRLRIYIAGPLSADTDFDERANVEIACSAARDLMRQGWDPVVPHLNWHIANFDFAEADDEVKDYSRWMDWCFSMLSSCDAIYCFGSSPGTIRELQYNQDMLSSIPVFESLEDAGHYYDFAHQYSPEKWNVLFRRQSNHCRKFPKREAV